MTKPKLPRINRSFSYGGGVQSTAVLVLQAQGVLQYDANLFCNVGKDSENPDTLAYIENYAMPYAEDHALNLIELQRHKRDGSVETLVGRIYSSARSVPIPARMSNGAPGRRTCTADFKIRVVAKWLKEHQATAENPAVTGLGISLDEMHRARTDSGIAWQTLEYPLIDLRLTREACAKIISEAGLPVPPKSSCYFCLAGDTEVITRLGTQKIKDIVGRPELLVPVRNGNYDDGAHGIKQLQSFGHWVKCEVRSFGVQPLMRLTIKRGRSIKIIRATADHRWVLAADQEFVTTSCLKPGMRLASCRNSSIDAAGAPVRLSPFGIAQGFTFGDGCLGGGNRPAQVVFHGEKDKALLPYFSASHIAVYTQAGKKYLQARELPMFWKSLPPINESRSFLLGWLAGYFAADGTVNANGRTATLYSASRENLEFVYSLCQVVGVEASAVVERTRKGFGGIASQLYQIALRVMSFPETFWIQKHHRQRVKDRTVKYDKPYLDWKVVGVEETGESEEVFCAIVPGVEMFTLAGNLLTGNCPFHNSVTWTNMKRQHPDLFEKAVDIEKHLNQKRGAMGKDRVYLHPSVFPLAQAVGDQMPLFPDDPLENCESGYCMI